MGTFYAGCLVTHPIYRDHSTSIAKLLVDTGSEYTWISETTLRELGVEPEKKVQRFVMADGRLISRPVGFAILRVGKRFTIDEVIFAQKGDLQLLGARTLEGLNLTVNPARKKLVAAGPVPAAVAHLASRAA